MLFAFALAAYTVPILNVTCPVVNLSLSLDCHVLGINTSRDCECACLSLTECRVPLCAYSLFERECADYGNCVDKCICQEMLCTVEYTPQSTNDYWTNRRATMKKEQKEDNLIATIFGFIFIVIVVGVAVGVPYAYRSRPAAPCAPDEGFDDSDGNV